MSLRKTAKLETPHATFANPAAGWEWRVLKVNQPKRSPFSRATYATWYVAARSPHTFGSWEYGDTYAVDVISTGRLVAATDEFVAYTREF
jgi:hypothetical protein